jgi:hypothetical protein
MSLNAAASSDLFEQRQKYTAAIKADNTFRTMGNYAQFLHEVCGDFEAVSVIGM